MGNLPFPTPLWMLIFIKQKPNAHKSITRYYLTKNQALVFFSIEEKEKLRKPLPL
jgi:aspartyl aminopeptidase